MRVLDCTETRKLLPSFHDDELTLDDQVAVDSHLDWCDSCAAALEDMQAVGSMLRHVARQPVLSSDEARAFQRSVVARMNAERSLSFAVRVRDVFDDMRLVYAGLGATVAAVACLLMMLNMLRFAREDQRPQSLAAIVSALASAGTQLPTPQPAPSIVDARPLFVPSLNGATFAADSDADIVLDNVDAEYVLAGIVTREGRVANLELVHASSGQTVPKGTVEAHAFQRLMGAVSQARYEPARVDGLPVAVNKVWLVPHTTVHGRKEARAEIDSTPVPGSKRRLTSVRSGASSVNA